MTNSGVRDGNFMQNRITVGKLIIHVVFIIYSLCCIIPIIIVISSSLSNELDIVRSGYGILPKGFTTLAYKTILKNPILIVRSYGVTTLVSSAGVILGLWLTSSIAYVISRKDFVLRRQMSLYVFFTMIFNGGTVPFYILISVWMGLQDNILALILPYLVSPWYVLIFKGFFKNISVSLIEAAKMDGEGELGIFVKIILPLSKPAIATVGLLLLLQYWNDWWLSLLFINNEKLYTLQYLLVRILNNIEFMANNASKLGVTAANMIFPSLSARFGMCLIAAGPMLFIFMFFQKYFATGIMLGSIKE
jgi:putative aldouronate transport system permease protein